MEKTVTNTALALYGGPKVKTTPFSTGKRFGLEEARHLLEALEQNTLFIILVKRLKPFSNNLIAFTVWNTVSRLLPARQRFTSRYSLAG